jgi:hypothetical protein
MSGVDPIRTYSSDCFREDWYLWRVTASLGFPLHRLLLAAAACSALSIPSYAVTPPPPLPFDSIDETLNAKPVTRLVMGRFVISLEVTALAGVQKTIGVGSMEYQGDGADAASWLCYTLDSSAPRQRLWIVSNAEMGGPERLVDGVRAQYGDRIDASSDCPSLPKRFQPVSLNRGLWLGKVETSIRAKFGSPSKTIGNWEQFYYLGKTRGDGKCAPDGYDVTNGFSVKIEGGVVNDVQASQVTSC